MVMAKGMVDIITVKTRDIIRNHKPGITLNSRKILAHTKAWLAVS
jgi:hypothetical protein